MKMNELIKEGLCLIEKSSIGHLPLFFRNKLLYSINDKEVINRISILCAFKVYPIWKASVHYDYKIIDLLASCEDYCNHKISQTALEQKADELYNYVQSLNDGKNFAALMAGSSSVQVAYELINDTIYDENENIDDFDIDSTEWDASFLASLAYNGGAESINDIQHYKNKEFWTWYLTDCTSMAYDKKKKIINLDEITYPIFNVPYQQREQERMYLHSVTISTIFEKLKDLLNYLLKLMEWQSINVTIYSVACTSYDKVFYCKNGVTDEYQLDINVLLYINNLVKEIKKHMYALNRDEGGFFSLNIELDNLGNFKHIFNYDKRDIVLQHKFRDEDFVKDFKTFHRKASFIPEWLKNLLNNFKLL